MDMLHKFFRRTRESFRRSKNKNVVVENGLGEKREQYSVESNESSVPAVGSLEIFTSTDSTSKKVTFKDCSESTDEFTDERNGQVLFDNNVLEAIQDGQLSIADFLKDPDVDKIQKVRSMSDSGVSNSTDNSKPSLSSTGKKLSLLDRAHSMAVRHNTRKTPGPMSRQEPVYDHTENQPSKSPTKQTDNADVDHSAAVVTKSSPRFSKSLEDLAQEVFGEQFQSYLESASKSPVKISVSKDHGGVEKKSPKARPALVPQLQLSLSSECSFDENLYPGSGRFAKSLSPRYVASNEHGNHLKIVKTDPITRKQHRNNCRNSLMRTQSSPRQQRGSRLHRLVKDQPIVQSVDIPILLNGQDKPEKNLESWNNKLDLRAGGSLPTVDGEMLVIVEEKHVIDDTREYVNIPSNTVYQNLSKYPSRFLRKLSTCDSQFVNTGSCSDIEESEINESTVMDFQFPPPPPNDSTDIQFDDSEWDVNETPYSSQEGVFVRTNSDPLIDSLTTIIPLPEDFQTLLPALTKAFSEIISEIIASRRKLSRILKAISIHQEILKEQSKQIQLQALQISGLQKTTTNSTNQNRQKRRPQSARTHRQSREMVELNLTLDKLLHQCSTFKNTPRNSEDNTAADLPQYTIDHPSCDTGVNVVGVNDVSGADDQQYSNFLVETVGDRKSRPTIHRSNSLPVDTKHRMNDDNFKS